MKSFLIKVSVSVAAAVIILQLLAVIFNLGIRSNTNLKTAYVREKAVHAAILFLGPCQVEWIIQPAYIEKHTQLKTYNLGLTHADFADNYLNLYLYLQNNPPPQYLFLYVSPESMDVNYNLFNTYRFAAYAKDSLVNKVLHDCDGVYSQWIGIPFMQYAYYNSNVYYDAIQGLKQYINHQKKPYYKDGFVPPWFLSKPAGSDEFVRIYPPGYLFLWDNEREKYLRKVIELALQQDIHVCLYESPVVKQTRNTLPNRKEIIHRIQTLAAGYNVPYVQFNDLPMADSGKNYLSSVILTVEASAIFSDTLGKYIATDILKK